MNGWVRRALRGVGVVGSPLSALGASDLSIILSGAVLLGERGAGAFKGLLWRWVKLDAGEIASSQAGGRVCRSCVVLCWRGVAGRCVWWSGERLCGNGLRGRRLGRATRGDGRKCALWLECGALS